MNQEVAKTSAGVPAVDAPPAGPVVLNSDLVLEKVLLMQGLSELVNERKAQQGDIVKSVSAEKLGDIETPVAFIPLTFKNKWMLQEDCGGSRPEYRGMEERNAKNEDAPWEFTQDGAPWKRVKVTEVWALLMSDIEKQADVKKQIKAGKTPDLNATLLPVVISFRSTSFKAGQGVVTHFGKANQMSAEYGQEILPYAYSMALSAHPAKNEKGSFFVYKVKTGGKVNDEALNKAKHWVGVLDKTTIKVDESDEESEGKATTGATGAPVV